MNPMPKGKPGQVPGPYKPDGSFDWVDPPYATVEVCGDVETGKVICKCECGRFREVEAPHAYRSTSAKP